MPANYIFSEPLVVNTLCVTLEESGYTQVINPKAILSGHRVLKRGEHECWIYGTDTVELLTIPNFMTVDEPIKAFALSNGCELFNENQAGFWGGVSNQWMAEHLRIGRNALFGFVLQCLSCRSNDTAFQHSNRSTLHAHPYISSDAEWIVDKLCDEEPRYMDLTYADQLIAAVLAEYRRIVVTVPF